MYRHKGVVKLMFEEEQIYVSPYNTIKERKKIYEKWKLWCGPKYELCCIQIVPQADSKRVKKDGTNSYVREDRKLLSH